MAGLVGPNEPRPVVGLRTAWFWRGRFILRGSSGFQAGAFGLILRRRCEVWIKSTRLLECSSSAFLLIEGG
jgi:hypothetical protein